MKDRSHRAQNTSSEPARALRANFTKQTMSMAVKAKKRAAHKNNLQGLFSMKSVRFMRTIPGAAIGLAIIATGSVGVYALSNWFGGDVAVKQDASIMHIDVSSCKGDLPLAGVEPSDDRHDIKFKITGNPHISAQALQHQILVDCESNAVREFYNPGAPAKAAAKFGLQPATITAVDGSTFTISYRSPAAPQTVSKTFTLTDTNPVYDQGKKVTVADFHAGDYIQFAVNYADSLGLEGTNPYANAPVQSIFKTQYDTSKGDGASKGSGISYKADNILPIELYGAPQYK